MQDTFLVRYDSVDFVISNCKVFLNQPLLSEVLHSFTVKLWIVQIEKNYFVKPKFDYAVDKLKCQAKIEFLEFDK